MLKQEFEALAGYEVSTETYNKVIEPMYMATDMDKREFVKCLDKKYFALRTKIQLLTAMKKEAKHLMETAEQYTDFESRNRLEATAKEYAERFWAGLNWFLKAEYTGDRFWSAPGRGCSFPATLVITNSRGAECERIKLA